MDLLAATPGVVHVRIAELERLNRIDPLEVFTRVRRPDRRARRPRRERQGRAARRRGGDRGRRRPRSPASAAGRSSGSRRSSPGRVGGRRQGVPPRATARERFEASVRAKVEGLGSTIVAIAYVADDDEAVEAAAGPRSRTGREPGRRDPDRGRPSTDPSDPFFVAIEALGGRVVRHGVPAHPGSMLWLARIGRTAILGLPTCGAYSKATAADLLLPRLLTGEPATRRTVARSATAAS